MMERRTFGELPVMATIGGPGKSMFEATDLFVSGLLTTVMGLDITVGVRIRPPGVGRRLMGVDIC